LSQQIFVDLLFVDILSLLGTASPSDIGDTVVALGFRVLPTNPLTAALDIFSLPCGDIHTKATDDVECHPQARKPW
jgi:hypothetical protein